MPQTTDNGENQRNFNQKQNLMLALKHFGPLYKLHVELFIDLGFRNQKGALDIAELARAMQLSQQSLYRAFSTDKISNRFARQVIRVYENETEQALADERTVELLKFTL